MCIKSADQGHTWSPENGHTYSTKECLYATMALLHIISSDIL